MFWLQNYLNVEKMNNSLLNERDSYKSNILFRTFLNATKHYFLITFPAHSLSP